MSGNPGTRQMQAAGTAKVTWPPRHPLRPRRLAKRASWRSRRWRWRWAPSCRCWTRPSPMSPCPPSLGNLGAFDRPRHLGDHRLCRPPMASSVPLTGWLMGRYGVGCAPSSLSRCWPSRRRRFLCGIAWSLPSLIFFRVLQGGASGPMIHGRQALLNFHLPAQQARHRAGHLVDLQPGSADLRAHSGRAISPDNYHWGWIFLINVPVGMIVTCLTWVNLKSPRNAHPQAAPLMPSAWGC